MSKQDYRQWATDAGEKAFRGDQIAGWIYGRGATAPSAMTNLSKSLRLKLAEGLDWSLPAVHQSFESTDGTSRLLLRMHDGRLCETVIMRYEGRTTLCVSSQLGCRLACSFCQTGKTGFFRQLSTGEIVGQVALGNQILNEAGHKPVSHVVFMGMGEPLDNYEEVIKATNLLLDPDGFGLSARHVTLSTSGIVPRIHDLIRDTRASLAVSLHAADDALRTKLMPVNRRYPLAELKTALRAWQAGTGRKITIEYILIRGENAGRSHAKSLVRFLQGLRARVNLIPFNPHPGMPWEKPTTEEIAAFQQFLSSRSIPAPVRYSRGPEISAACGQLAAKQSHNMDDAPGRANITAALSD